MIWDPLKSHSFSQSWAALLPSYCRSCSLSSFFYIKSTKSPLRGITQKEKAHWTLGADSLPSSPYLCLIRFCRIPITFLHGAIKHDGQPFSARAHLCKNGSCTGFRSITLSLLHQHQIGLQPAWHCADSQGNWTLTHLLMNNLPPKPNRTICR